MRRLAVVSSVLIALLVPSGAQAWTWPVEGPVLRPFVFGSDPYAAGQHRGIDVGGGLGESVRAPAAGTVSFAGSVPAGGRALTIRTADGYSVTLLQLGSIAVERGEEVAEGARVGTVGESSDGVTREPHVHLGVRRTDDEEGYLDPLAFLPGRTRAMAPAPAPAASPPTPAQPQPTPPVARVEEPAQPAPATAPQPPSPVPAGAPTWSEDSAVAAAEPTSDAGGLQVAPSARPAAAQGLVVRAERGRPLARAGGGGSEQAVATAVRTARLAPGRDPSRPAVAVLAAPRTTAGESRPQRELASPATDRIPLRDRAPSRPGTLLLGLVLSTLVALAAIVLTVTRKARPIIDRGESLLPDHPDLLRQLDPAHRARLHDDCGGHPRAPSPPARRGRVPSHRDRRARGEGAPGRRGARAGRQGVRRPDRRGELATVGGARRRRARLLHSDD